MATKDERKGIRQYPVSPTDREKLERDADRVRKEFGVTPEPRKRKS
jgi:hypothetical protein